MIHPPRPSCELCLDTGWVDNGKPEPCTCERGREIQLLRERIKEQGGKVAGQGV